MKRRHETRDDDDDAAGEPEKGREGGENERPQKRPVEEAGRTKTSLYNEEAAGRLGTGSSHYRRSSSATRLSVLVVRHANVERPARCTCSRTAHRSSVTAPPHTRARALHLPLPLVSVSSLFFSVSWLAGNIFLSSARCRPRSLSHRQFSSSNLDPLFSPVPGERVPSSLLFFCRF